MLRAEERYGSIETQICGIVCFSKDLLLVFRSIDTFVWADFGNERFSLLHKPLLVEPTEETFDKTMRHIVMTNAVR